VGSEGLGGEGLGRLRQSSIALRKLASSLAARSVAFVA
jgi:hypothetical protein